MHKNSRTWVQRFFAINLSHRDKKPKYISKFWTKHGGDGKQWPLPPFPFLAPWPSRPPAIETPPPSPCWAPHFMTQERIMFSNPTPSKPRRSPAASMSDATPSALTLPLRLYLAYLGFDWFLLLLRETVIKFSTLAWGSVWFKIHVDLFCTIQL